MLHLLSLHIPNTRRNKTQIKMELLLFYRDYKIHTTEYKKLESLLSRN